MQRRLALPLCLLTLGVGIYGCAASRGPTGFGTGGGGGTTTSTPSGGAGGTGTHDTSDAGTIVITDAQSEEPLVDPDAACAAVKAEAAITVLPVDIIWMVDNSVSMAPAITEVQNGLNAFANTISGSGLDYQVIMLSLRSATSPVMIGGSARFPVCIPPPLAGDNACGDGPRFFQSSIDIRSTQPLEQFLGTLGQTAGYTVNDAKGGPPWKGHLRASATKTIVVVTDDNSRLDPVDFETFPGGQNPFNSLTLPPGILDPSYGGLFDDYVFSGIYGWGSDTSPSIKCTYPDQSQPPSAGATYTTLVKKTGGVRAKLCEGAAAWQPFFDDVAKAVIEMAKLSCEIAIPTPEAGTLDPTKVNVVIGGGNTYLPAVTDAAACAGGAGWYYDDANHPSKVQLCPASCDAAQMAAGPGKPAQVDVLFGCQTILK